MTFPTGTVAIDLSASGARGPAGSQFIEGDGAPASSVGNNGDFYFDSTARAIYGPKTGGAWGSATSLVGAEGPAGPMGSAGNVAASLADLKAAAIVNDTMLYDGAVFTWTAGDFTGHDDEINVIASSAEAITVGAWLRQTASSIVTASGQTVEQALAPIATLAELKAAPIAKDAVMYDGAVFTWTTGDFTGKDDEINVVVSNLQAITVGAWVRQVAASIVTASGQTVEQALAPAAIALKGFEQIATPQMYYSADDGADWLPAINRALAVLKATPSRTRLLMPYLGGGSYTISDTMAVDFSGITVEWRDKLQLTKTTPAAALTFIGTAEAMLTDIAVISPYNCTIDGNGSAMTGYTYVADDTPLSALFIQYADKYLVENLILQYGLVSCGRALQSARGVWRKCDGVNSVYDNGLNIEFNPPGFNPNAPVNVNDPSVWASTLLDICRAYGCAGFGITTFGAIGTRIESPEVWNCGNNSGVQPAGSCGGMSSEHNSAGSNPAAWMFDHRVVINNPRVEDCFGDCLFVTAPGTHVYNGKLARNKVATAYSDPNEFSGHGIAVEGAGTLHGSVVIRDVARNGILALATNDGIPNVSIKLDLDGAGNYAIYSYGGNDIVLLPGSEIKNIHTDATQGTVTTAAFNCDNSGGPAYNDGLGSFRYDGIYLENCPGPVATIVSVGAILGKNLHGLNIGSAITPPGTCIQITNSNSIDLDGLELSGPNSHFYYGALIDNTNAFARVRNIAVGALVSDIDNNATIVSGQIQRAAAGVAPAFTPYAIGDTFHDTTGAKAYIANGISSAADWLLVA